MDLVDGCGQTTGSLPAARRDQISATVVICPFTLFSIYLGKGDSMCSMILMKALLRSWQRRKRSHWSRSQWLGVKLIWCPLASGVLGLAVPLRSSQCANKSMMRKLYPMQACATTRSLNILYDMSIDSFVSRILLQTRSF